ncbi:MAG TPA: hypothetical protein VGA03_01600, partial [Anaerolineales bacterium]
PRGNTTQTNLDFIINLCRFLELKFRMKLRGDWPKVIIKKTGVNRPIAVQVTVLLKILSALCLLLR